MTLYETPIMTKQTETKSTKAITTHNHTYGHIFCHKQACFARRSIKTEITNEYIYIFMHKDTYLKN